MHPAESKNKCRFSTAMSMSNKLYNDGFHNSFPLNLRFKWGLLKIALMIHDDTCVYIYMCVFTYLCMYLSTSPISWNFWTISAFTCWLQENTHTIIIFIHPHCKQQISSEDNSSITPMFAKEERAVTRKFSRV